MNGSAVDSAVATLFCIGLFNMESCGIGGGGFMNVYLKNENKSIIYDFRETAPAAANKSMFLNASSVFGKLKNYHLILHPFICFHEKIDLKNVGSTNLFCVISLRVKKVINEENVCFSNSYRSLLTIS